MNENQKKWVWLIIRLLVGVIIAYAAYTSLMDVKAQAAKCNDAFQGFVKMGECYCPLKPLGGFNTP